MNLNLKFCKQNTVILIVRRENQLCKTSTRHRKNSKQSVIVAIDSCFALSGLVSMAQQPEESCSDEKYPRTMI